MGPRDEVARGDTVWRAQDRHASSSRTRILNDRLATLEAHCRSIAGTLLLDPEGGVPTVNLWQHSCAAHLRVHDQGHVLGDGTGYIASKNDLGFTTHQILANYQFRTLGGEAYLRVFEFLQDGKTVKIKAYSPLYGRHILKDDHTFTLALDQPR